MIGLLARDATAEPVSRNQILTGANGDRGKNIFPCLADHELAWQPYPVDPYSARFDDYTYIHTVQEIGVNHTVVLTSGSSWKVSA